MTSSGHHKLMMILVVREAGDFLKPLSDLLRVLDVTEVVFVVDFCTCLIKNNDIISVPSS